MRPRLRGERALTEPESTSSALAVGALISAFLFSPLGIVLGLVAKAQSRRTGTQAGDRIATAAIVIGAVGTVVFVVLLN